MTFSVISTYKTISATVALVESPHDCFGIGKKKAICIKMTLIPINSGPKLSLNGNKDDIQNLQVGRHLGLYIIHRLGNKEYMER